MPRQNCWEYKQCGRQPGGAKAKELGVCPAATDASADGLNRGQKGGRICWAVGGTLCGGKIQGSGAQKLGSCMSCGFYKRVMEEEGLLNFHILKPGQPYEPPED